MIFRAKSREINFFARGRIRPLTEMFSLNRYNIMKMHLRFSDLAISAGLEQKYLGGVAVATASKYFCERQLRLANM